jgi:FkbM family methyltransferase
MGAISIIKSFSKHPIGRKKLALSVYRFLSWQIYYRFVSKSKWVSLIGDTEIMLKPGMAGATGNHYLGLLEFPDMSFLLHLTQSDDVFLDIGANVGVYTLLASGHGKCNSVAIEPVKNTFEQLNINIKHNGLENRVKCYKTIVSNSTAQMKISNHLDAMNHVLDENDTSTNYELVNTTSLDKLIEENAPTVLKIDVEGAELSVIKSGLTGLKRETIKAIIIETNGDDAKLAEERNQVKAILNSAGFEAVNYEPFSRKLTSTNNLGEHNTIFVRDKKEIQKKMLNAKAFSIMNMEI